MDLGIQGLRVLVTAGAAGIGLDIARAFVGEGARVHVCDVDRKALTGLSKSDPAITWTQADVSDRSQVMHLFDEALSRLSGLDSVINNAGISGPTAAAEDLAPEDWDRVIAINLTGQFNCARIAIPHLRQSENPSIINLSSIAGRLGMARRSPYCASKWGVIGFTKSLSLELGKEGIRVNSVLPGLVEGDRLHRVIEANAMAKGIEFAEAEAEFVSYVAMKKTVSPQEIADVILFLCSHRGRTISGQAISVCGDVQMLF
ncbi:MAG: 3-ketoacyl-ACP reductase [Alphaproteobacteria bacterium]|nr:MAG: 3-ketoacyl-ACP reductase [Alphaproteobacteria bacterium]